MSAAEPEASSRVLLGLLLIEMGVISHEQLEQALAVHGETGQLLGEVLVSRGFASRLAIQDALAKQAGYLLEPESGYGTGLRMKLVEGEGRSAPPAPSATAAEEAWEDVVQTELRLAEPPGEPEDVAAHASELQEREHQVEQLARDLEASLRTRLELEARVEEREQRLEELAKQLREREERLGALASELQTVHEELTEAQRPAEVSALPAESEDHDDFLAAVGRARSHLAARRALLQEREAQLRRQLGHARS
jgi:DNA repair exonuclease SbcCD ATPase subunit